MSLADAFAAIGVAFSSAFGGPFYAARVISETGAVYDAGGSIVSPGSVSYRDCSAQVDVATLAMRQTEGFVEEDRRILVLASSLAGEISTANRIEILEGPYAGVWMIESIVRDPAAVGYELRGRKA